MAKIPGQIPQYVQLYEKLRAQIEKGEYNQGDLLPSESELKAKHNITQPVVRHALALLVNEGFIKKHQGKGSIVQTAPPGVGLVSFQGVDITSQDNDENIKTKIISAPKVGKWPEELKSQLHKFERNFDCITFERVRSYDGEIVFYEKITLPYYQLQRISQKNFENKSFYKTLRKSYELWVKGSEQKFSAVITDKKLSKYLKLNEGTALLKLERRMETNKDGIQIYSTLYANTEKHLLIT